jgi:hypothetical protein
LSSAILEALRAYFTLVLTWTILLGPSFCAKHEARWVLALIEIDVFSGRPNPTFDIGMPESDELRKLMTELSQVAANPPEPGLGYRGFIIHPSGGKVGEFTSPVRVYGGYVIVEGDTKRTVYRDTKSIEEWLKQKATDAGFGELVR